MSALQTRADTRPLALVASQEAPVDPRVKAVLEVIAGTPIAEVAATSGVEVALVHRWVHAFVDGGTARVTNRPEPELARQRDRFLAAFAHELRTPLAVARGWAAMLTDGDLPQEMTLSAAEKLDTALAGLTVRVNDVERLAAASLGRLRVTPSLTTPREVARLAGVPLEESEGSDLAVVTDPELAARALSDLWTASALPPEPRARQLRVVRAGAWWELRILRDADPIEPRVLQALFEPFDVNDDGTGVSIGLYLARALAVALGGTIGLEQHDDRGELWLRFPLSTRPDDTTHEPHPHRREP